MKRMKRALIGLAVGAVAALGVVGLAACGDTVISGTATGEYHYANPWSSASPDYGVRVEVTVEEDIIQSVKIVDHDWVQATEGWEHRDDYLAKESTILGWYKGLDVDDVMKLEVAVDDKGQPETQKIQDENKQEVPNPDFNACVIGDTNLIYTTATQSCARILLAVQDAIENIENA